jgi:predicted lipoprotein with Yx(FWY)xxD motif
VISYFLPDEVSISRDQKLGGLLTTKDGMTLYARETARYPASGIHHARGGALGIPGEGIAIGLSVCFGGDEDCKKKFRPFRAPVDAKASGFWSVYVRPDGSKQWAYMGYALFTFDGDRKPGDKVAYDTFDLIVNSASDVVSPPQYRAGLYWRIVPP